MTRFQLFSPLLDLESFVENVSDETFLHSDNIHSEVYNSLYFFGLIRVSVWSKALGLPRSIAGIRFVSFRSPSLF
jgi:hypothetical protein